MPKFVPRRKGPVGPPLFERGSFIEALVAADLIGPLSNGLANPSIENGLAGLSRGTPSGSTATTTRITTDSRRGSACVECAVSNWGATPGSGFIVAFFGGLTPQTNAMPCVPGDVVGLRGSVKIVAGDGSLVLIKGRYFSAAGADLGNYPLSTPAYDDPSSVNPATQGRWYDLSAKETVPTTVGGQVPAFVCPGVTYQGNSGAIPSTARFDKAMAVKLPTATAVVPPYFEGRYWHGGAVNLVPNPNVESNDTGVNAGGTTGVTRSKLRITSDSRVGSAAEDSIATDIGTAGTPATNAVQFGTGTIGANSILVAPGDVLGVRLSAQLASIASANFSDLRLVLGFYDNAGTFLTEATPASAGDDDPSIVGTVVVGRWYDLAARYVVPTDFAGVVPAVAYVKARVAGLLADSFPTTTRADAAMLVKLTSLTDPVPPYFSGTAPVPYTGPTLTTISRVSGRDASRIMWQSNKDFSSYMIRVVPAVSSLWFHGTLLEQDEVVASGAGVGGTPYVSTITDAELEAALGAEGANVLKLFTQDPDTGEWSS